MQQQRRAKRFRPIHGFFVALFLMSLWVAAPHPSTAQTSNLALNRPVTTSSIEGSGFEGSRAVDGSGATRWASLEGVDPQWIRIDLGATATVSRVWLSWEAAYARGYRVEISADSSAWTPLYTTSSGDGGIDDLTVAGSGRYLRIYGTARGTAWGYSLFEVEVYGTTTPPTATPASTLTPAPGTNLALGKAATGSATCSSSETPAKAVNGSVSGGNSDKFCTAAGPRWLQIDLGSSASVSSFVVRHAGAGGENAAWNTRDFNIQLSLDGATWTPTGINVAGNLASVTTHAIAASATRYVRLNITTPTSDGNGAARIYEFEVYGTGGPTPTPVTPSPTPSPTPPSGSWNLVWSDEFNQAAVNTNNWKFIVSGEGGGNNERQYYTNGQNTSIVSDASAEDSKALLIEARKENPAGYQCWYGACQYTSARLVTEGKKSWQYGRIEARMKLPAGNGIWPAFWMMGNSGSWPASGEIDVMELVGGTQCGSECGDNHTHGYMWWSENGDRSAGAQAQNLPSGKYSDAYHVFGVEWDAQQIRWTIDGQPLIRADNGQPLVLSITGSGKTEFHQPFYILLNIAVGGDWPLDPPSSTPFPQRMYVDWVRVYQK